MTDFDWIIVGSGFGGSVSALRLAEKGYRVCVVEKGKRFSTDDFPKTNWDFKRWYWAPALKLHGIFKMSFLEHATILHGVGVGGGSLVYANTLPVPKDGFFTAPSWRDLADWKTELGPHYATAKRMLGAAENTVVTRGDEVLHQIARDLGREHEHHPTTVAVYFGEPGKTVDDPYFGGEGPPRTGCTQCGACMTGCRVGAKNSLDRNYLYLAEKLGVLVEPETEVVAIRPLRAGTIGSAEGESPGYAVEVRSSTGPGRGRDGTLTAAHVVFAGGVMGTVPLLLRMQKEPTGLPDLSPRLGKAVRTNSEALIGVISPNADEDFSQGVAITSIFHCDEHSHIEPVRYGRGSGFFRTLALPHSPAPTALGRFAAAARGVLRHPWKWLRAYSVRDFAKQSQILLYMRTLEGTLALALGRSARTGGKEGLVSKLEPGSEPPKAFMSEATDLAERFASKVGGVTAAMASETALGVPSTAHILGGCCMGDSPDTGVIDAQHRVFGYPGLYVVDGSAVSANPGVNPSLTIAALAERAMSFIPAKAASIRG